MRVTLIHNPGAGDEEHSRETLEREIERAGHDVNDVAADEDWGSALSRPADLVVVAGGDGTVAPVVALLAGRDVPLVILPLGSANNIARTLELGDGTLDGATWSSAPRRRLDIGCVAAGRESAPFVESFGGGVFAEVLRRAEDQPGDPGGASSLRQGRELLSRVIDEAAEQRWEVWLDGRDVSGAYIAVEVMNIREIGPNVALNPAGDPGDRMLDVVMVSAEHAEGLAHLAAGAGQEGLAPAALRGTRVVIRTPAGCPLHVDDDLWPADHADRGSLELEVDVGRAAVDVLAPGRPAPAGST